MKKIAVIFLIVSIMTSFVACGEDKTSDIEVPKQTAQIGNSDIVGKPDETADDSALLGDINTDINEENNENDKKPNHTETAKPSDDTAPVETAKPAHEHSYNSAVTKEATCGHDGVKTFTCSCGNSYTEKIDMTGKHAWCEWETIKEPDTKNEGLSERKCSVCSATESKVIEKTASKRFADVVKPEILDDPNYTYPAFITNVVTNERYYTMHTDYYTIYDYNCYGALLGYVTKNDERVITFAQFDYKDTYDGSHIGTQIMNDIKQLVPIISENATISYCLCNEDHRDITDTIDEFLAGLPEYLQNTDGRVCIEATIIDPDAEFKAEYSTSVYKDNTFIGDVIIRRINE